MIAALAMIGFAAAWDTTEQINAPGAYPTMFGMSGAWAGLSGAYTTERPIASRYRDQRH